MFFLRVTVPVLLVAFVTSKPQKKHEPDYDIWDLRNDTSQEKSVRSRYRDEPPMDEGDKSWSFHPKSPGSSDSETIAIPEDHANRKFVVLRTLQSGQEIEEPFEFTGSGKSVSKISKPEPENANDEDDIERVRLARQDNSTNSSSTTNQELNQLVAAEGPSPAPAPGAAVASTPFSSSNSQNKNKNNLTMKLVGVRDKPETYSIWNITKLPEERENALVYVQYTHELTALERAGDTRAKLGDACLPRTILEPDYCERASYPNKNKMFCMSVDDPKMGAKKNTCVCKYYRSNEPNKEWRQLTRKKLTLNGEDIEVCLVPKYGVCNHRTYTGLRDNEGKPIYEIDECQGHFQCDNSRYYKNMINKSSGQDRNVFSTKRHCSEEDFLNQFDPKIRKYVLTCSKPAPNKFRDYDQFKYYCLSEESRVNNE